VTFADEAEAEAAVSLMNGKEIKGRSIVCQPARPKVVSDEPQAPRSRTRKPRSGPAKGEDSEVIVPVVESNGILHFFFYYYLFACQW
jgi:RNA recognition motif-containing protein